MKDNYDFSNAIKNPFADRINAGYSVRPYIIIEDSVVPLSDGSLDDACEPDTVERQRLAVNE